MKKIRLVLVALLPVAFSVGCASYEQEARTLRAHWTQGQFVEANRVAGNALKNADSDELLLWQLEQGATLRACGNAAETVDAFEKANRTLRHWEETPEILLSSETLATLTNLSVLPYRGRSSDIIMLHTLPLPTTV